MEPKKIALLVGALLVALVTAVLARSMFASSAAPQAEAAAVVMGPKILVATRPLPVGTIIDVTSFKYQPWPAELIEKVYYMEGQSDAQALQGSVVRSAVTAGQPLTLGSLVQPGDRGFLAAALGAGMRAITVSVSVATGGAGFVFPGDRVDLMLTQTVDGGEGPSLKTTETFIRNIRVLAVDQRTDGDTIEGKKEVRQSASVTLEATPRIAEKIAVAQKIGELSLSLRSIADNTLELERAIAAGTVSVPKGSDPAAEKRMLLQIASQPLDSETSYVTGADVSRFQRRTAPSTRPAPVLAAPVAYAGPAPTVVVSVPQGPVVRVTRGNTVTVVPVGGK